jgi:hypothetical protein
MYQNCSKLHGTEIQKNWIFHGVVRGRLVPLEIVFQGRSNAIIFGRLKKIYYT